MKTKSILMGLIALSSISFAQVPTAGLVGRWDFDNNLNDASPTANHGTWQGLGSPTFVSDRCQVDKFALHFNGINDYVEMNFGGPSLNSARTLSFWMRTNNTNAGDQSVVRGIFNYGLYTRGNTGSRWEICHNYGCQGVGVDISHEYFTTKSSCVNNGQWHHVVATQDLNAQLNQTKIYIDGILMPAPSVQPIYPSGFPNCSPTSNIGVNNTDILPPNQSWKVITVGCVLGALYPTIVPGVPGRFYDGDLDEMLLYDRVLTSVEIAQLFAERCEMRPCISCDDATKGDDGTGGGGGEGGSPERIRPVINLSDKNVIVLDQNTPNPFAESTVISYNIPENFAKAQLIFFTTNGNVIKTVDIVEKGKGSLNIVANDLSTGIYAYKLVVDGKTIDTKKMVKE